MLKFGQFYKNTHCLLLRNDTMSIVYISSHACYYFALLKYFLMGQNFLCLVFTLWHMDETQGKKHLFKQFSKKILNYFLLTCWVNTFYLNKNLFFESILQLLLNVQ